MRNRPEVCPAGQRLPPALRHPPQLPKPLKVSETSSGAAAGASGDAVSTSAGVAGVGAASAQAP